MPSFLTSSWCLSFSSCELKFKVSVAASALVSVAATVGYDIGASFFGASGSFGGAAVGAGACYCTGSAYFGGSSFYTNTYRLFWPLFAAIKSACALSSCFWVSASTSVLVGVPDDSIVVSAVSSSVYVVAWSSISFSSYYSLVTTSAAAPSATWLSISSFISASSLDSFSFY